MGEKVDVVISAFNKFIGPMLATIITILIGLQAEVSDVKATTENLKSNVNTHLVDFSIFYDRSNFTS